MLNPYICLNISASIFYIKNYSYTPEKIIKLHLFIAAYTYTSITAYTSSLLINQLINE